LVSAQVGAQGRGRGPWNQRDNRNNRNNRDCDDRDYDYDDDDYRNTGYGRNGNYNLSRLQSSIQSVRDQSRTFQDRLDNALDNSRYDDRQEEDRVNQIAKDFRNKADDLKDRFGNGRDSRNLDRSQNEARELLRLGEQLDNFLSRNWLDRQVQNDWNQIARNLEVIADAYGYDFYARNGGYRRNDDDYYGNNRNRNRRNNNGGWRSIPNVIGSSRWPF
jgi:hypothetical protein